MTTPDVHPQTLAERLAADNRFGLHISPHAVGTLTARARRNIARNVRTGQMSGDTGLVHGPAAWHEEYRGTERVWTYANAARVLAATDHIGRGKRG